jgi:membrane AbrB-like protein
VLINQTLNAIPVDPEYADETTNSTKRQQSIKKLIILGLEILLAIPLGYILAKFNIGGIAWIFGGIVAGAIVFQGYRSLYQYSLQPNRAARQIGMVLVGLTIGFSNAQANFASVASAIPVYIIMTLFLLFSGTCIGYIYARLSKINLLTALLATVPGGVGVMAAIAADYNRNVTLVALVQVIRVTSVVLLIPLVVRASVNTSTSPQVILSNKALINLEPSFLSLLGLTLVVAAFAVKLAVWLKIPAAPFFSALIVGITFNYAANLLPFVDFNFTPPPLTNLIGQILLGITIGEYWGEKPTLGKRTLLYAIISTIMTLGAGAGASLIAMQLTNWDWLTCLLVTAPGGSAEMILVALALDHNVDIVTGGHLVRLIAINCSLPIWVYLFRRIDGQIEEAV